MPNTTKKSNSINDQFALQLRNNQNTIEILTKLDQSINSNDSFVTIKLIDDKGNSSTSQIPTIGYFKSELDRINKTVKILSGIEGNPASIQIANNAFKRIITADLNLEPRKIDNLDPVSTFKTNPNWIFDSFLNPKISVEINLTDKIDQTIRTVQCRRFIVTFEQTISILPDGSQDIQLTTTALLRQKEFNEKYKGKSNIDIVEFVQWLKQPGLVNRVDNTLIDEDFFRIEPNRLQYQGVFTVLNTEIDEPNKKLWYVLNTLNYFDVSNPDITPTTVQLKVGDLVNVNPNQAGVVSTTVYRVIEISTVTSDYRVRFEQVYGEEPIPVRINALNFYSELVPSRKVRVSIGYDEYNVLFLRSYDEDNNLQGKEWSAGIGFYTNELTLDTNNGQSFSEYYVKTVYDYGLVLEDLVQKKVPNYYGIKPNAPVLVEENFKVVQSNLHLTNTVDAEQIRDLHNTKNNLTSEILQIQEAIDKKNKFISTTLFDSQSDRKRAEDELYTLQTKLTTKNETKFTTVKNILASQKNLNKISPVYKLRGFWAMVEAVTTTKTAPKTAPQEAVQYEVWYRRLSKSGAENPISTFTNINNVAAQTSSILNTTVNANLSKAKTVNAVFSNWTKFKTDARKRVQDPLSGDWLWEIEDVSDANTPNINQLELDINPGEKIEFKVKTLSEVGWPETPVESDFSNTLTIPFPDDLNNVLSDDQFILKEASADELKVHFERDMEARGLNLHLSSSFRVEDLYYAHTPQAISSGFKDSAGKTINLYDKLLDLVNQIKALNESIKLSKGELTIFIINKGSKQKIFNGNSLTFNLNLESYMKKTKIGLLNSPVDSNITRCYANEVTLIDDFVLELRNDAADSPLGLLATRNYGSFPGSLSSDFSYRSGVAQPMWLDNTNNIHFDTTFNDGNGAGLYPAVGTQTNNQWIWLQNKDISGNNIYTDSRFTFGNYQKPDDLSQQYFQSIKDGIDPSLFKTTLGWSTYNDVITDETNEMALSVIHPTENLGFLGENIAELPVISTVKTVGTTFTTMTPFVGSAPANGRSFIQMSQSVATNDLGITAGGTIGGVTLTDKWVIFKGIAPSTQYQFVKCIKAFNYNAAALAGDVEFALQSASALTVGNVAIEIDESIPAGFPLLTPFKTGGQTLNFIAILPTPILAPSIPALTPVTPALATLDITNKKYWSWTEFIAPEFLIPLASYGPRLGGTSNNSGVIVIPKINNFLDIKDTSAQKTKIINSGDTNAIQIPLNIYFRPFVGTHIMSYNTSEVNPLDSLGRIPSGTFDDTLTNYNGGDMPEVFDAISPGVFMVSSGILTIKLKAKNVGFQDKSLYYLKRGDKIVVEQMGSALAAYNGVPMVVTGITYSPTGINLNFNVNITGTYTRSGTETITQIHLWTSKRPKANEFKQFSVYGNLTGQDTPYIKNYIEYYTPVGAPNPDIFDRKLRFYIESETNIRPIEFQFNWKFTQYKKVL